MKRLGIVALIVFTAPVTPACVSIGPSYDPAAVARLTPGMDRAEVIALLGCPSTTVTLADGSQHLVWTHSRGSISGARARSLTLVFSPEGKCVRIFSEAESSIR